MNKSTEKSTKIPVQTYLTLDFTPKITRISTSEPLPEDILYPDKNPNLIWHRQRKQDRHYRTCLCPPYFQQRRDYDRKNGKAETS